MLDDTTSPVAIMPSPDAVSQKSRLQADTCTFTPQISKKAPRAWERKPATPFAPRTESHKIWKRCDRDTSEWASMRETMTKGQHQSWRSVKRMRIGLFSNENEDYWGKYYVGTRFDDLGDVEQERRRKLVTGGAYENLDLKAERKEIEDAPSARIDSKCGASRCDAALDENANPKKSRRPRSKQTLAVANVNEATLQDKQKAQEERHKHDAHQKAEAAKTHAVVGSNRHTPSSVKEVVQDVSKNAPLPDGDDAEYLHAFLTRAKAKKAARSILSPERHLTNEQQKSAASSPQTRSRAALATLDGNSPSPMKMRKIELPARKPEQEENGMPGINVTSPLRKSSRTRIPRAQRHQPTDPSSIPLRRSNGTEFVFLQKTEAQEIALATRSNTKRNKGQALQPKMKIEALSSKLQPSPEKVARKSTKKEKRVSWDEELAYFAPEVMQPVEAVKEQTEAKTPVKRSRRLASGKGTPAPKKMMAATAMDITTPLPRTRTRAKSKN
jgi:hypothetical protein